MMTGGGTRDWCGQMRGLGVCTACQTRSLAAQCRNAGQRPHAHGCVPCCCTSLPSAGTPFNLHRCLTLLPLALHRLFKVLQEVGVPLRGLHRKAAHHKLPGDGGGGGRWQAKQQPLRRGSISASHGIFVLCTSLAVGPLHACPPPCPPARPLAPTHPLDLVPLLVAGRQAKHRYRNGSLDVLLLQGRGAAARGGGGGGGRRRQAGEAVGAVGRRGRHSACRRTQAEPALCAPTTTQPPPPLAHPEIVRQPHVHDDCPTLDQRQSLVFVHLQYSRWRVQGVCEGLCGCVTAWTTHHGTKFSKGESLVGTKLQSEGTRAQWLTLSRRGRSAHIAGAAPAPLPAVTCAHLLQLLAVEVLPHHGPHCVRSPTAR